MRQNHTTRRRALLAGAAVLTGLAGCTGDDGDDGGGMDGGVDGGVDNQSGGDGGTIGETDGEDDQTATDGDNETTTDGEDNETATDGDDETTTDAAADVRGGVPSEPSDDATVAMETEDSEQYFEPELTWVTSGSTVTFVNESGAHSSTAYAEANDRPQRIPDDAEAWDSGTLSGDAEFEHTFETEGVYDYFCIPHETMGMVGTVVVGEPDPEGQPGLEEPQDELDQEAADRLAALDDAARSMLDGGQ